MNAGKVKRNLFQLARLYNIQTAYQDITGRRRQASVDSLLVMLQGLGAPVASLSDVSSALRERKQNLVRRIIDTVAVAWDGKPPPLNVRLPSNLSEVTLFCELETEKGDITSWKYPAGELSFLGSEEIEGEQYILLSITLPESLPLGYHKFRLEIKGKTYQTLIISAPRQTYLPPEEAGCFWGAFLPLYALQTQQSWGSGDYSGLGALVDWVADLGGRFVATLPLLPNFLNEPLEPCPYMPVSRLLWDEFFIDVTKVPELTSCPEVQDLMQSSSFQSEIADLRQASLVDYRRTMALKRRVLEKLSGHMADGASYPLNEFRQFITENPVVDDYAVFRATVEKQKTTWPSWPEKLPGGFPDEGDYNIQNKLYHMYVQWLAQQQVQSIAEKTAERNMIMYLDLPLGVHREGYDVWRHRDLFTLNVDAGAPPDAVFTTGQNWGFPPLHPENIREQGYRYVIDYIRHHVKYAGMLRIDHMMGFHRLFWIPSGMDADQGVYVRYPAEELYAILALESHRHRSIIVGEDLGMVPSYVRPAMKRHGLQRMYVMHYELADNPSHALRHIDRDTIASLNTHDMPPFASFWQDMDIKERLNLGILDEAGTQLEISTRQSLKNTLVTYLQNNDYLHEVTDIRAVLKACLSYLSASRARILMVNLEDLWLETHFQNVPSADKYPNWQNKARYMFEEFSRRPEVLDILRTIDRLRRQKIP